MEGVGQDQAAGEPQIGGLAVLLQAKRALAGGHDRLARVGGLADEDALQVAARAVDVVRGNGELRTGVDEDLGVQLRRPAGVGGGVEHGAVAEPAVGLKISHQQQAHDAQDHAHEDEGRENAFEGNPPGQDRVDLAVIAQARDDDEHRHAEGGRQGQTQLIGHQIGHQAEQVAQAGAVLLQLVDEPQGLFQQEGDQGDAQHRERRHRQHPQQIAVEDGGAPGGLVGNRRAERQGGHGARRPLRRGGGGRPEGCQAVGRHRRRGPGPYRSAGSCAPR